MPQAANIALVDALATPVTHTFVPVGPDPKDPQIFLFEDQSAASPIGNWRISVKLKRPPAPRPNENSGGRVNRVSIVFHMPILENVSNSTVTGVAPAPTVSYVAMGSLEYVLPERSSLQVRKDLRLMTRNLLADSQVIGVVENLLAVY